MKNLLLVWIGLCLILLPNYHSKAQQYNFQNYSLEEGLPQSEVFSILQDKKGNLWLGTNGGGISRFNGKDFISYDRRHGLADNNIRALYQDSNDNLWIGTSIGISSFNGVSFKNYAENQKVPNAIYVKILEDHRGRIWALGFNQNQRFLLYRNKGEFVDFTQEHADILNANQIRNILIDHTGTIYIISLDGAYEFKDEKLYRSPLNDIAEFKDQIVAPALEDDEGNLWFTNFIPGNGFVFYKMKDNKPVKLAFPDNIPSQNLGSVMLDSQNHLWLSIFGTGIVILDGKQSKIIDANKGLISPFINNIAEDREGNIWMTSSGNGLIKYGNSKFLSLDFSNDVGGNIVRAIFQDSKGNYWFSLSGKGIVRYNKNGRKAFTPQDHPGLINIRDFNELPNGKLLMAGFNGLIKYDGKNFREVSERYGLPRGTAIIDILYQDGELWLSTQGFGVIHYDKNGKRNTITTQSHGLKTNLITNIFVDSKHRAWFSHFQGLSMYAQDTLINFDESNGLNYKWVMQVAEDSKGRIWAATFSGGINIYDGSKWEYITTENGLSSNIAYSILKSVDGTMWVGSQNGVDRVQYDANGKINNIRNYNKYDGFTGIENNGSCNYIDKKGNLWFGTINGAMMYNSRKDLINPNPPIIQLTDIKLFFRKVNWRDEKYSKCMCGVNPWFPLPQDLSLTHDMHHLSFDFEALSYKAPEKVKYQWKLEGLDQDWSPISTKNEAVYSRIPPGEYTFKIKASNSDGVWTPKAYEYHFEIRPPWYYTWWAIGLGILFIASLVSILVQWRLRNIKLKKLELEHLVSIKTKEVREQKFEIESQNKALQEQKNEILEQSHNLQKSYMNLIHLNDIGKIITANLSIESIIDTVYESVNELMDASIFGIGIYNKKNNSLLFPRIKEDGANLDAVEFSLQDETRLAIYCYKNEKDVFITDLQKQYHKYITKIVPVEKSGTPKSVIYLPLKIKDKITGVITVQSFSKNAYQNYHLSLLQNIAVYASIAVENAQAYKQIESQSKRLERANKSIRKQKEEIELKNNELTDLNTEKNHLIGIIAHDLKNPLTSTISITEYLRNKMKSIDNSEDLESISFMLGALNRMNQMISKILDIGVIESKSINLQLEKTNLKKLVEIVNINFKDHLHEKQLTLNLDLNDAFAIVDKSYMTQVYENLISNAIKFSPTHKNIWVKIWEEDEKIRSLICDEGPGIPIEDQSKLFGKFQILSTKPTGGEKSTGLGLSIVKKYVDAMKGKVWCESEPGKGAKFYIELDKAI